MDDTKPVDPNAAGQTDTPAGGASWPQQTPQPMGQPDAPTVEEAPPAIPTPGETPSEPGAQMPAPAVPVTAPGEMQAPEPKPEESGTGGDASGGTTPPTV